MRAVVVGTGLTHEVVSPDNQYLAHRMNVGPRESGRLLGRGREFGSGPLVVLLERALAARDQGADVDVVLLEETTGDADPAWVGPIQELDAKRLTSSDDGIPI